MSTRLPRTVGALAVLVATAALLLLALASRTSTALSIKDLAADRRCPACVAFATALRRASWEAHPPFDIVDRRVRRRMLNHDNRCMELLTEAMDVLLVRSVFVYTAAAPVPTAAAELESLQVYYNETDAAAALGGVGARVGRFWSLQDLYVHRRLRVADFMDLRRVQQHNMDQSLMHFLHNELREELGEETEALCYLDLFHSHNKSIAEYYVAPSGEGSVASLSQAGKVFGVPPGAASEWLNMNILKDAAADAEGALDWAAKLCSGDAMCGNDSRRKGARGGGAVREYMRSVLPVFPAEAKPRQYEDETEKPLINEDF